MTPQFCCSFRSGDAVARWGSEEFVVGLYGATQQQTWARIVQLQPAMYQQEFSSASGQKFRVTFSGGISEFSVHGTDLQALYRSAAAALYQAKAEGRNRVVIYNNYIQIRIYKLRRLIFASLLPEARLVAACSFGSSVEVIHQKLQLVCPITELGLEGTDLDSMLVHQSF